MKLPEITIESKSIQKKINIKMNHFTTSNILKLINKNKNESFYNIKYFKAYENSIFTPRISIRRNNLM